MNRKGLAGCGCLIVVLIVIMVLTGVLIHPTTLRFVAGQFRYEDKMFTSDAIFVPRFPEDKNGELYMEAFREYSAGNGKFILLEDDTILGTSIVELVGRMARARNVRDDGIRKIAASGDGLIKVQKTKGQIERQGFRKVIVVVPEYASRRFHLMYDSSKKDGGAVYLIKPVYVTFFRKDTWWKDGDSRGALAGEAFAIGSYYLQRFTYGEKEKKNREK